MGTTDHSRPIVAACWRFQFLLASASVSWKTSRPNLWLAALMLARL